MLFRSIEIKTPNTRLLGKEYRDGVFPLSVDLNGAIAQAVHYRQELMKNFASLSKQSAQELTLGEPPCIIIAGSAGNELSQPSLRNNFELLRERTKGVTIVTFDELFARVRQAIGLLGAPPTGI